MLVLPPMPISPSIPGRHAISYTKQNVESRPYPVQPAIPCARSWPFRCSLPPVPRQIIPAYELSSPSSHVPPKPSGYFADNEAIAAARLASSASRCCRWYPGRPDHISRREAGISLFELLVTTLTSASISMMSLSRSVSARTSGVVDPVKPRAWPTPTADDPDASLSRLPLGSALDERRLRLRFVAREVETVVRSSSLFFNTRWTLYGSVWRIFAYALWTRCMNCQSMKWTVADEEDEFDGLAAAAAAE